MTDEALSKAVVNEDALASFREQIKQEDKSTRPAMSDTAIAKLRAIKEQDRIDAVAGERFKNALSSVVVSESNLQKLIGRCDPPPSDVEYRSTDTGERVRITDAQRRRTLAARREALVRRGAKLNWWITAGFKLGREIDSVTLINFFSSLTRDEIAMNDRQFASTWDIPSAKRRLKSRIDRGIVKADVKSEEKPSKKPSRSSLEYKQARLRKRANNEPDFPIEIELAPSRTA